MARAGFGGSGDYGSFFGSLYSANRDSQRAQQDASDQDAFDKWQNGLMSDDEWSSYMTGRVQAYAGDPKRQEKWVTYVRKYSQVIADSKAEYAYKNGETSLSELIAHYQTRVANMDGESAESRDMKLKINDLMDQRSVEGIQTGAQKIQDAINKGTKSYQDLEAFYKSKLGDTRPNSDLRTSLEKELKSTREQIRTSKVEGSFEKLQYDYDRGALSGGAYATRLRAMAVQFKDSDPKRYYQILEAAVALKKSGGSGGGGGGGGHSGGGSGGGGSHKGAAEKVDSMMAERNRTVALIEQYDNGAKVGVDPVTGKPVVFSEAKIKQLDRQLLANFDGLAAAYTAKGDKSAATAVQVSKSKYISDNVVKHNTISATEAEHELMRSTGARLTAALDDPDPTRAMASMRQVAADWDKFSTGLEKQAVTIKGYKPTNKDTRLRSEGTPDTQGFGGEKGLLDRVDPEMSGAAKGLANALKILTKPGLTEAEAQAAIMDVERTYGGSETASSISAFLKPVLQVHGNEQGLATGEVQRVVTPKGVTYARTYEVTSSALVNGVVTPTKVRVPDIDGVDPKGEKSKTVEVFIDINGEPTKVTALATRDSVQGMASWFAKSSFKLPNGTTVPAGWVTEAQIANMGGSFDQFRAAGKVELKPSVTYWKVDMPGGTDAKGNAKPTSTWVQDEGTGMWYKDKLPIRGVQTDAYGAVKVGDGGMLVDYKSFSSASGAPAPYSGGNAEKMQMLMDEGHVDTKSLRGRDVLGNVTDKADLKSPYWNGEPLAHSSAVGDRDSWWDDEERAGRADTAKTDYAIKTGQLKVMRQFGSKPVAAPTGAELVASSMGINLKGTQTKQASWSPKAQAPGATGRFEAKPAPEETGGLFGTHPKPQAKTFSGPRVLDATGEKRAAAEFKVNFKKDVETKLKKTTSKAPKVEMKPVAKPVAQPKTQVATTTRRVAS